MVKNLSLLLLCGLSSFAATFYTISSNQFTQATNNLWTSIGSSSNSIAPAIAAATNGVNTYIPTNVWATLKPLVITTGDETVTNTLTAGNITIGTNLIVGGGTAITKILTGTATLDFPAIATNSISTLTITVTGAGTNGCAFLNIVTPNASCTYTATIESTNTVTVRAANISTNDGVNPAATSARVVVFQY